MKLKPKPKNLGFFVRCCDKILGCLVDVLEILMELFGDFSSISGRRIPGRSYGDPKFKL